MIAIIDYGAGNLNSVKKAFDFIKAKSAIVSDVSQLKHFSRLVLPGVGAFGSAMEKLRKSGFVPAIKEYINNGGSFLGICLGMQLLLESSEESRGIPGLTVFKGKCKRFKKGKVPQIGWNQVEIKRPVPLLQGIDDGAFFYFIHGYYVKPVDLGIILAETSYHLRYASIVGSNRIWAVQFHPEKSGENGLTLLKNWVEKC